LKPIVDEDLKTVVINVIDKNKKYENVIKDMYDLLIKKNVILEKLEKIENGS
jgi:PII-like signaling protein